MQKKTLDPVWNEKFSFHVNYDTLISHKLVFFVYDWDASGNNRIIGASEIALAEIDFRAPINNNWLDVKRTEYESVCTEPLSIMGVKFIKRTVRCNTFLILNTLNILQQY